MEGDAGRGYAHTKNGLALGEKYIKDVKQNQKVDPDQLELIMRLTCLVKEKHMKDLFQHGSI